ncbi:G2 M phase-specific E3 ubiquitin- ligase-like [Paramuricea clavata]|uniref:G2 M phase-specific E3 ubiquitin- ligase-like n=1 Tax=Paramuricea clavata TaxID=317549 RepID=A0A6S7IGM9_PARCT|nr:G2 M phase-specific E3 ubiquitin- ligase-like [Paramuricea clavata]
MANVDEWATLNNLPLNADKMKIMVVGGKRSTVHVATGIDINLNGSNISQDAAACIEFWSMFKRAKFVLEKAMEDVPDYKDISSEEKVAVDCLVTFLRSIVSSTSQSNGKRSRGKGEKNGLGEKKITVEIKDKGFEDLYSILLQEFPLLSHAGGIELMRTGFGARSKTLEVIPVPTGSSSYSIQYLKEVLQQAKCYVRPIQKDLPVVIPHDCQGNLNTSINEESSCPSEQCRLCLKSIPILQMRRHMWSCEITESSFSVEPEIICESDEESNSIPESLPHSESPSTSGSSSMVSYMEPGIDELRKIFPDPPNQVLVEAMLKGGTVEEASNILLDQTTTVQYRPSRALEDSIAAFKNPKFKDSFRPRVRFLGEAGVDAGGLSREYGLILRKEIFSSNANLFEGKQTRKLPIYNINGIQSNLYYLAGKMVAYLIIHLDIGIPMLSPAFYYYLVSKDIEKASEYCCIEDVPDHETKEWINQVNEAKTNQEILELVQSHDMIDSLLRSGWVDSVTLSNRDIALQNLIVHEVLVKRKEALDQFCKGLKALGVHSAIRTCPEEMKVYFIAQQRQLSATTVLELFANIDAVQECDMCEKARDEGEAGLKKFMCYMTCAEEIPPLGMPQKIEVVYVNQSNFFAETCMYELKVPKTHESLDNFKDSFMQACAHNKGFGAV